MYVLQEERTYDSDGKAQTIHIYDLHDGSSYKIVHGYDNHGAVACNKYYYYDPDGKLIRETGWS